MRNFDPRLRMIEVAMKTTSQIQRLIPVSACLLFAMAAMSCQTNTKPPTAAVQQPVMRKNWVKVSSQPPTYYPKGVAADCPTDHWSGEWVDTDDEMGSRYYIPHRGLGKMPRQTLVHEALSARSERRLAQIANEDRELRDRSIKKAIIFGPLFGPPFIAANLVSLSLTGQAAFDGDDFARWQKEWHTSKHPEENP